MLITADGLGTLKIGTLQDEARKSLRLVADTADCKIGTTLDATATVFIQEGKVALIAVQDPGPTTPEGIGVGDGGEGAEQIYGPATEGQIIVPANGNELVIGLNNSTVTYLWARRQGVEIGC